MQASDSCWLTERAGSGRIRNRLAVHAGTNNNCPPYVPSSVISDLRSGSEAEAIKTLHLLIVDTYKVRATHTVGRRNEAGRQAFEVFQGI